MIEKLKKLQVFFVLVVVTTFGVHFYVLCEELDPKPQSLTPLPQTCLLQALTFYNFCILSISCLFKTTTKKSVIFRFICQIYQIDWSWHKNKSDKRKTKQV